jgi:conjugative transposon TraM protein
VAFRLVNAAVVNGLAVPSGQLLYGEVSMANERLMVRISSLRVGEQVMPVSIQVYDLDGLAGIRVPGAVTREVSKESASEAISGLGLASMDPSLTGQAANAGLQMAKTLTSRKVRTVRVKLPEGYQVLLVNTKTK